MAGVEKRPSGWRVVWREAGVKQFEPFDTESAARKFQLIVEAHGNHWPPGWVRHQGFTQTPSTSPSFDEWAVRAINSRSRANARTRHDYLRDVTRHLSGPFGSTPVDQISREAVGLWLVTMSEGGASAKTIKNVHGLASSIVADAIAARVAVYNPFKGAMATLPNVKHEEMTFLSRGEFDTLLSYVTPAYRVLVLTLGLTGLRWSEVTALRVCDIDVLARRLSVVQAWKRTPDSYFVIGEPKSHRSRRTITIPRSLASELIELTAGRPDADFLFVAAWGRPVRHANFRERVWLPAVKQMQRCREHQTAKDPCGCLGTIQKTPRIHDVRHSHASWLIAAGVALPAIQRRLGHESITTTIDRYGHLAPELDDAITDALDGDREPDPALI